MMVSKVRTIVIAVFVSLSAGASLADSTPLPQSESSKSDEKSKKLDELLQKWEKALADLQTVKASCSRISVDHVFSTTEVSEGTFKSHRGKKPDEPTRVVLELHAKSDPAKYEKCIRDGKTLYVFHPDQKMIRVMDWPAGLLLFPLLNVRLDKRFDYAFLFGIKAGEARKRFKLTLVEPAHDDKWYAYLKIEPRTAADKADFIEARLVLWRATFLPRQFWCRQPNGNEMTWDIPHLESGAAVNPADFDAKLPGQDWQFVRVP